MHIDTIKALPKNYIAVSEWAPIKIKTKQGNFYNTQDLLLLHEIRWRLMTPIKRRYTSIR